jgi:Regulator of chromosome condensation (RCC1) repeat
VGERASWGNGHRRTAQATPVRVRLPRSVRIRSVRADCDDAIALTTRGHVYAWGGNTAGQLGNGSTKSTDKPVRVKLPTGTKIKAIRAGCDFNLALTTKGHVLAWGSNASGQLGIGTKRSHDRPVRVKFHHGTRIKAISAGLGDGLAITTKGHVVVTDERHLADADGKQVEPPWIGVPPQAASHLPGVAGLHGRVLHCACDTADLELPFAAVPAGDHAVHQDARVPQQVGGLPRLPHHGQPQVAVHDKRLDRADPRRAVTADRRHEHDAGLQQPLPPERGQARLTALHLRPAHAFLRSPSAIVFAPAYHALPTGSGDALPIAGQTLRGLSLQFTLVAAMTIGSAHGAACVARDGYGRIGAGRGTGCAPRPRTA